MSLTKKQKIFIKEYQTDYNATAAARRAGYSYKNADKIASNLIGNSRVLEEVNRQIEQRVEKLNLSADQLIFEIYRVAFSNPAEIIGVNNHGHFYIQEPNEINRFHYAAIKSFSYSHKGFDLKFSDKLEALKLLGDKLNLWKSSENDDKSDKSTERIIKIIQERQERRAKRRDNSIIEN